MAGAMRFFTGIWGYVVLPRFNLDDLPVGYAIDGRSDLNRINVWEKPGPLVYCSFPFLDDLQQ